MYRNSSVPFLVTSLVYPDQSFSGNTLDLDVHLSNSGIIKQHNVINLKTMKIIKLSPTILLG